MIDAGTMLDFGSFGMGYYSRKGLIVMKMFRLGFIAALFLLVASAGQSMADFTFSFTETDNINSFGGPVTVTGTLQTIAGSSGLFIAIGGTATVTNDTTLSVTTLLLLPTTLLPGTVTVLPSPISSYGSYDNILTPSGSSYLDVNGLAFTANGTASGNSTNVFNIYFHGGAGATISPDNKYYYSSTYSPNWFGVSGTFTLTQTPEPTSLALLVAGAPCLWMVRRVRNKASV